ncbi:MAG: M48 family metalloprotease [Xanthomonadales bacterium]|nr:M48 family metalloprotease [Xanthomonadales bacterium]
MNRLSKLRNSFSLLLVMWLLTACATNAVTGERNLQFYGADWEQKVGEQMYAPLKQSQGGDFVVDPALTSYVQTVGNRLAQQARRKEQLNFEFSVLNDSSPNAWALPGGKIVVNRGLLTALDSEAELAAVIAHEIVHADAAHGAQAQSKGMLTQVGSMVSMVVIGSQVDNAAAREIAMLIPQVGAQMLNQKYGRDAERESDEYGMLYMSEAGYDPQGAVELQKTFLKLSEGRNQDWLSGLFASHPPSQERLQNNIKTAQGLPAEGETGRARYQEQMTYLIRVQPAYDAYDAANKALADDNTREAQKQISRALSIVPKESLFHALQGDIYAMDDKLQPALNSYTKAISANNNLFYGYLRRGQAQYKRSQSEAARADLEKSLSLLPTAEAHYLLGMLDKNRRQGEPAMKHFQAAAQSNSESGSKARRELLQLDLPSNPSRYVASRAMVDKSNVVWAVIANQTGVAMRDIEISYAWLDESGQTRQSKTVYRGPLASGKQDSVRLGIQLNNANELNQRVRLEVTAARIADE